MNFKKFIGLQCNIELICQHLKMLLNILNAMSRGYGVMKKQILKIRALLLVFSITTLYSSAIFAQMPGISSSMLSEYNNMSSSQKRNLAEQYGINLNTLGLGASGDLSGDFSMESGSIGGNTKEIETDTNKVLYERIIEAQDYRQKAEERRRKNIPIFERDYTSLEELPIYGQFLFDGKYSTFAPMNNIPVPHNYVLGAGDSLRIDLFGSIDSTIDTKLNLTINRIGEINFPELGAMSLAGMTFSEAKEYIESRVSKQMIGVNLNVSIGRLKSINVFMAGESKIPGAYSVSGLSTVSQALFVAGGITNIGSLRDIQIKRSGKVIQTYDLYKLLSEGNSEGDIRLQSGDVIFIPPIKKVVFVDGSINRPGRYELKENETISDLLLFAGGNKSRAYRKQVHIERYDIEADMPSIINLDLTKQKNLKFTLKDGDIIRIPEVDSSLSNSITLRGAVKRPGKYGWFKGIRLTDIVNSINVDFSSNFDMNKGLIIRRKNKSNYDIKVLDFNIKSALENPKSELDPNIELHDEILIFALGNNNDILNDIETYDPKKDSSHPSYGKEEKNSNPPENNLPLMDPDPYSRLGFTMKDQMTYEELRIELYEAKKELEYNQINKGKRRVLLDPVIKKLSQQATSSESLRVVSISGAVKVPGEYPLVDSASYLDLIELAGGYSDDAYIEAAELRKTITDSSGTMIIDTFDVNLEALSGSRLDSRDHIHVRSIRDWTATDSVALSGEVAYPGTYLISPNEKLSSVIRRAGGFTGESFVEGAVFTRESIKDKEREQLRILGDTIRRDQAARSMTKESEDFSVSSSEVEAGITALLSSEVYGRLIINLPSLMSGDNLADIVLQDGDVLSVPKYTNAVTVVGEVRRSGSFVRQDSYKIDDYIELAAGMTARGDNKKIYIIRANGTVEKGETNKSLLSFNYQEDGILAGDTIVVPIKSSYQTPLNLYRTVSQVVFQSIASIAAFSTVFN